MSVATNGLAVWACLAVLTGCTARQEYHRVEQAPKGIQIDDLASARSGTPHRSRISNRYPAPYEQVWQAALAVVPKLEQLGELPVSKSDKATGRIEVRETHRTDQGEPQRSAEELAFRGWKDDFLIEIQALSADETQITVRRTVLGIPGFRACRGHRGCLHPRRGYEPEESNGEIEEWFLTQVENELGRR
jgi:hypothetical protein